MTGTCKVFQLYLSIYSVWLITKWANQCKPYSGKDNFILNPQSSIKLKCLANTKKNPSLYIYIMMSFITTYTMFKNKLRIEDWGFKAHHKRKKSRITSRLPDSQATIQNTNTTKRDIFSLIMIVFNTDAMLRLFFWNFKIFSTNIEELFRKARYGSPRCFTMASTSGLRNECLCGW